MTSEPERTPLPPVHTLADLDATWCRLIKPLGFGSRQIFAILMVRDGELIPELINITDCPEVPEGELVAGLASTLRHVLDGLDEQGSCAVMWARPSSAGTRETDLLWARALVSAMREAALGSWPVYCADDFQMRVVGPDDLAA